MVKDTKHPSTRVKLVSVPQPNSLDPTIVPPLGLLYIAAVLEREGFNPSVVDLGFVPYENWSEAIGYADIMGVTVLSPSFHYAVEVKNMAKRKNPGCIAVAGGSHATSLPLDLLREGFEYVVKGEGEMSMLSIVQGAVSNPVIEGSEVDLARLPFPARHLVSIHRYTLRVFGVKATSMITSRGCPYRCAFCDRAVQGRKVRFRPVEDVVSEIKHLMKDYGFRAFRFFDDIFTLKKDRLYSLCDELEKLGIIFQCYGNARTDTLEDFQRLYKAGCRVIEFGIESGSQKVLDAIHKDVTVEQNRDAILNAKRAGLLPKADIMVGNPCESWETVTETINFMKETKPDLWAVSNMIPYPGSQIYHSPERYGIKLRRVHWKEFFHMGGQNIGGLTHDVEGGLTAEEIAKAREHMIKEFPPQTGPLPLYYEKLRK